MQRGRNLKLAVLAGTFALAGWCARPGFGATAKDLTAADVGTVGTAGSTVDQDGKIVQKGSGADVWETNDQFQFASQKLSGNGSITARLLQQDQGDGSDCCVKSGVMIRATADDDSANVYLAMNTGEDRGVLWQYRPRKAEASFWSTRSHAPRTFPTILRLERRGDYIYGWQSQNDGKTYQQVGYAVTLDALPAEALFGLATTAHTSDAGGGETAVSTSTFDQVTISNELLPDPVNVLTLPRNNSAIVTWESAAADAVTFNIYGRKTPAPTAAPPAGEEWVKINDQPVAGRSYTVEGLTNGTAYDFAVAAVVDGQERGQIRPEERHTGHIGPVVPMAPLTIGGIGDWVVHNIGTNDIGHATVDANGKVTMDAGGTDAWDQADGGSYLAIPLDAENFVATARIVAGPTEGGSTDGWTNGGLAFRETLQPSSRFVSMQAANLQPIQLKPRLVAGRTPENTTLNGHDQLDTATQKRPLWFRITRKGDVFTGEYSLDETADPTQVTWIPVGNDADGNYAGTGTPDGPTSRTIPGMAKNGWIGIRLHGRAEGGDHSTMEVDGITVTKG